MSSNPCGTPRGAVLLEVLIALVVLASVGSSAAWLTAESLRAVSEVQRKEGDLRGAARLMSAVSLWPTEDLERHLGVSAQGPWRLYVGRPKPSLYVVSIADSVTRKTILRAAVLRQAGSK